MLAMFLNSKKFIQPIVVVFSDSFAYKIILQCAYVCPQAEKSRSRHDFLVGDSHLSRFPIKSSDFIGYRIAKFHEGPSGPDTEI